MSKRKNQKTAGMKDALIMCAMYALLIILFFIPGIILNDQPISAFTLASAAASRQFGAFPPSIAAARQMFALPLLCGAGLLLTLLLRRSAGKYAFGACTALLLFGLTGIYQARYLAQAGGFVFGAAMIISLALLLYSVGCSLIRK